MKNIISGNNFYRKVVRSSRIATMRWTTILGWPIAACVIAGMGWTILFSTLNQERLNAEANAIQVAQTLARGYAAHLARTMEAVDQTLIHVRFEWQLSGGKLALDKINKTQFFSPLTVANVDVIDREGLLLTSTLPRPEWISYADRSYFRFQKISGRDALFIDVPISGRFLT
jgi:hypothetical protein